MLADLLVCRSVDHNSYDDLFRQLSFSLADIGATPYILRLEMLQMLDPWTAHRPRVGDWFDRIHARPTFTPAFLEWMPDELTDDLRTNGTKSWPEVETILNEARVAAA